MSELWLNPRRSIGFVMLALASVAPGMTLPVAAQTAGSGRINGALYRDRGEKVPAAIVVISTPEGLQRMTRTNAEGSFMFSGLPAGSYAIQGCAEEFGPSTPASIELKVGMVVTQDLRMGITGFVKTAEPSCSIDSPIPPSPHEYTGGIMSFDLKGDIREFFQSIALISDLKIDVEPSVNRTVTVHLKDISWDLALDVVVRNSGLGSELDGGVLRIAMANPLLGQDRALMGTVTIEGSVTEFRLQNPRTLLQVKAPNADGIMQNWPVEWESADYLKNEIGIRPGTLKPADQIIVTGNITGANIIRLISVQRPSDGFSWGYLGSAHAAPADAFMFVSSTAK